MAYGLNAANDAGQFLLSTDYQHYAYIGRFSVTKEVPKNGNWYGVPNFFSSASCIWYCDIPSISRPIVLLDLPVFQKYASGQPGLGLLSVLKLNAVTWRVYLAATFLYTPAPNCVLAFVKTSDIGPSLINNGLRLYTADGELAFDSGRKPLVLAEGSINRNIWMTHAINGSKYGWAFTTTFPRAGLGRIGSYFTGNCAFYEDFATQINYPQGPYTCRAQAFNLFSYAGDSVVCIWSPVLMNCNYREYSGAIFSINELSAYISLLQGSEGPDYAQKVICVDPALY